MNYTKGVDGDENGEREGSKIMKSKACCAP